LLGFPVEMIIRRARSDRGRDERLHRVRELELAQVDAVFSNAALHWIPDAEPVVAGISRALKNNGRFVAEFGGKGNGPDVSMQTRTKLSRNAIPATTVS
jgi:SAM-dependent methyltransferase